MSDLNRRDFLALAAVSAFATATADKPGFAASAIAQALGQKPQLPRLGSGLMVCMHQASSERFDFRTAMEGYAKAGVRLVEPNLLKVREFAQKEGGPSAAKKLLDDLGLLVASTSNQLGLMEPSEQRLRGRALAALVGPHSSDAQWAGGDHARPAIR